MIVACLALGLALAGTGVAAVTVVLPRNSVGPAQLRANSVNSFKIVNGSIRAIDLVRGIRVGPRGPAGAAGPAGPAGPAGATGPTGPAGGLNTGASIAFKVASGPDAATTTSTSFTDLTSTSIDIPSGSTATVVATFSAESACSGGGFCSVRILIDGNEMNPNTGTDFAFDSSDNNTETSSSWESHAIVRSRDGIASGSHTVAVQYKAGAGSAFRLDDWGLSIIGYRQ